MNTMRDRRKSARLERERIARDAMRKRWHKPKPIAWFFVILSTIVLCALGLWQVQRLAWKEGLIADITRHQYSQAHHPLPESLEQVKTMDFARVHLSGIYLHEQEIHLAARYYHSQLGYHILTPFLLDDGRVVLVNRGWVHVDNKEPTTRSEGQIKDKQQIIAMIRNDNDRNYFTPEHDTEGNIWFWRDLEKISEITGYELFPVNLDLLYATPPGGMPIASDGLIKLRNDHLGYALTWFLIGLSNIVIFFLYHYHSPKMQTDESHAEASASS